MFLIGKVDVGSVIERLVRVEHDVVILDVVGQHRELEQFGRDSTTFDSAVAVAMFKRLKILQLKLCVPQFNVE